MRRSSLISVDIPDGVTSIGEGAFAFCSSLTSINIPDSVTSIGEGAFAFCKSLIGITIPSSVVSLEGNPFARWSGVLHNKSKAFIYEDDVLSNKDKTILIAYRSKETSYIIPKTVTCIGEYAFYECSSLISVDIPDSVTSIGDSAFDGCSSLTSVDIPDSVKNIGVSAFASCI